MSFINKVYTIDLAKIIWFCPPDEYISFLKRSKNTKNWFWQFVLTEKKHHHPTLLCHPNRVINNVFHLSWSATKWLSPTSLLLLLSLGSQCTDYICVVITQLHFPSLRWNCVLLFAIMQCYYQCSHAMSTGCSSDPTLCWLLNCLIKEKLLTWEFFHLYNKYER